MFFLFNIKKLFINKWALFINTLFLSYKQLKCFKFSFFKFLFIICSFSIFVYLCLYFFYAFFDKRIKFYKRLYHTSSLNRLSCFIFQIAAYKILYIFLPPAKHYLFFCFNFFTEIIIAQELYSFNHPLSFIKTHSLST